MARKVLFKRTTRPDAPSIPNGAVTGELFLNIASGTTARNRISTKRIDGSAIEWSDDVANEKKFATKEEVSAIGDADLFVSGTGSNSVVLKNSGSEASGTFAIAEGAIYNGENTKASGHASHAEGGATKALSEATHTEGLNTVAGRISQLIDPTTGNIRELTGDETLTLINEALRIGLITEQTEFNNTVAMKLIGFASHAEGNETKALGTSSHAEGNNTEAGGNSAHAEGDSTHAWGEASHAEGIETQANGWGSHAEGGYNETSGAYSHIEGRGNYVGDNDSYSTEVVDINTKAYCAHSEGQGTKATGNSAHAEGVSTKALGTASHAGGYSTTADGESSFAHGTGVQTTKNVETAFGKYNDSKTDTLFSVGYGSSSTSKKNLFEIKTTGDVYANNIKVATTDDIDELREKMEDNEFVVANALNQINDSAGFTEGGISRLPDQQTLTDAILELQQLTEAMEESDPLFSKSAAAEITDDDITNWNDKLDKNGKAISAQTADFAQDLTGRNEATPQSFTFQPSAGDMSIKDESAYIKEIKGNSVVWNQLFTPRVGTFTIQGLTIIIDETGKVNVTGTSTSASGIAIGRAQIVSGRKYIFTGIPKSDNISHWWGDQTSQMDYGEGVITTPTYPDENRYMCIYVREGETVDITFYPKVCDLTKMFEAGNEPATVEEFYARIPSGIVINAYNEGEIIDLNTEAIKTVGFNQWDEQWELGAFNVSTGVENASNIAIRMKNYMRILPNTKYYKYSPQTSMYWHLYYDKNKNYIGYEGVGMNTSFTTPSNAFYMRSYTETSYGLIYNNDICYNLSHTGYKDGTYEPYKEFHRELPVIKKYFPDGMKKAGNAFDSIEWDSSKQKWVAVHRIGTVDLGTLSGYYVSEYGHYQINISDKKPAMSIGDASNLTCSKYSATPVTYASNASKPLYSVMESTSEARTLIYVVDPTCTDASSYLSTLNGVILYYELAEPIVTEIEEGFVNFDYYVEDFGTEEAISSVASAPFNADIVYQFNAVDRIRQNDFNINKIYNELINKSDVGHTHNKSDVGLNNVDNTADANKSVKHAVSADSATTANSATTATQTDKVRAAISGGKCYLLGQDTSGTTEYYGLYKNLAVYMESGNLYASSDKTLKTHIESVDGDLDKIKRIPKAIFHWNDDEEKKRQLGTYAQDVEEVYPEIVTKDTDGIRGVAYDRMGVIALAGIDKLYEMVQQLQAKNEELEKRIKELENK